MNSKSLRFLSLLLALVLVVGLLPGPVRAEAAADSTQEEYYEISTADELYAFASLVNSGSTDLNARLMNDIVVNENVLNADGSLIPGTYQEWEPIGSEDTPYTGTFDGNGHTVSGLYFNDYYGGNYVGLLGYVETTGTVQNVGVINSYIYGNYDVGGVVGTNYGTVTGCYNSGSILNDYNDIGGVVGYNSGTVTDCYNTGSVTGRYSAGGVVGTNLGIVTGCYNSGSISGNTGAGGVVDDNDGTVIGCYNTGSVRCSGNNHHYVGGVVSSNIGTVTGCYNTGSVSGNTGVGGVVGDNSYGTVTSCYNTGGTNTTSGVVCGNSYGTVINTFYLIGATTGGIGGADKPGAAEGKTEEEFASGEIAYRLNYGITDGAQRWYQTVGEGFPVFTGSTVYKTGTCSQGDIAYSNTPGTLVHDFDLPDNTASEQCCCGEYQSAVWKEDEQLYEISDAPQLYWFAAAVNNGNIALNARLMNNITINTGNITSPTSDAKEWTPILEYCGTFDGNRHTISGLYFSNEDSSYAGLFGIVLKGGTVQNVGVENSYLFCDGYTSSVVGCNFGTVISCYNSGYVFGYNVVGGIVSNNAGTVIGCYNSGEIGGWSSNSPATGGIVGENSGSVAGCCNFGYIDGVHNSGGVVGSNSGTVSDCYNSGHVESGWISGGVVGDNPGITTNCYNTGSVSGVWYHIGGVVGRNHGILTSCYNTGSVTGTHTSSYNIGGIAGINSGTLSGCFYLTGCAVDGSGMTQYGIGASTLGGYVRDIAGNTDGMAPEDFTGGKVAKLLGSPFGQNIDNGSPNEGCPVFSDATVYELANCLGDPTLTNGTEEGFHRYDSATGKCVFCSRDCDHSDQETVTPPTCTEQGYTTYSCSVCGYTRNGDYVDATGHSYQAGEAIAPSCTEQGYTPYTCTTCGVIEPREEIPALGHQYREDDVCDRCGETQYPLVIQLSDSYGDSWNGCALAVYANDVLIETVTVSDGSSYSWSTEYDWRKTYTFQWIAGSYANECSFEILLGDAVFRATTDDCGSFVDGQTVFTLESKCKHLYQDAVTAPTCTEQGYTTHTCIQCEKTYTDAYVDPMGHSYEAVVTAPTCTEQGFTVHTCHACGDSYTDSILDAAGHSYTGWIQEKAATCQEAGYLYRICSSCADEQTISFLADHSYEDGVCTVCGIQDPNYIPDAAILYGNLVTFVEGEAVLSLYREGTNTPLCTVQTADAAYRMEQLLPGEYILSVSKEGHVSRSYSLTLVTGENAQNIKLCLLGDVNGDGRINVGDVSRIYAHVRSTMQIIDDYAKTCADVNGDGRINVGDTARVYSNVKNPNT